MSQESEEQEWLGGTRDGLRKHADRDQIYLALRAHDRQLAEALDRHNIDAPAARALLVELDKMPKKGDPRARRLSIMRMGTSEGAITPKGSAAFLKELDAQITKVEGIPHAADHLSYWLSPLVSSHAITSATLGRIGEVRRLFEESRAAGQNTYTIKGILETLAPRNRLQPQRAIQTLRDIIDHGRIHRDSFKVHFALEQLLIQNVPLKSAMKYQRDFNGHGGPPDDNALFGVHNLRESGRLNDVDYATMAKLVSGTEEYSANDLVSAAAEAYQMGIPMHRVLEYQEKIIKKSHFPSPGVIMQLHTLHENARKKKK